MVVAVISAFATKGCAHCVDVRAKKVDARAEPVNRAGSRIPPVLASRWGLLAGKMPDKLAWDRLFSE